MNLKKLIGLALLILGIVLLYFGFNQANSTLGEISEAITGKYTDETMRYLISGIVTALLGLWLVSKK